MKRLLFLLILPLVAFAQDETEKKVKTIYSIEGRAVHQSQRNKGHHVVVGKVQLTNGKATVTLNTSTENGKQDISFLADTTYSGRAWTYDTTATANTYRVVPISGTQFKIISSATDDSVLVRYRLDGE